MNPVRRHMARITENLLSLILHLQLVFLLTLERLLFA
jgi:hypothetical protein